MRRGPRVLVAIRAILPIMTLVAGSSITLRSGFVRSYPVFRMRHLHSMTALTRFIRMARRAQRFIRCLLAMNTQPITRVRLGSDVCMALTAVIIRMAAIAKNGLLIAMLADPTHVMSAHYAVAFSARFCLLGFGMADKTILFVSVIFRPVGLNPVA